MKDIKPEKSGKYFIEIEFLGNPIFQVEHFMVSSCGLALFMQYRGRVYKIGIHT